MFIEIRLSRDPVTKQTSTNLVCVNAILLNHPALLTPLSKYFLWALDQMDTQD